MYRYVHTCNLYFDYVLDSTFVQSLERIGNGLYVEYTVRGGGGVLFGCVKLREIYTESIRERERERERTRKRGHAKK
jgi:hypothetical protein